MRTFTVLLLLLGTALAKKIIPSYVQVCKRSEPEFDACVLKSVDALRPYLLKGIPKMRVPPYEPLVIPALSINRDLEALKVKAELKDIRAYGPSSFKVEKFKTDLEGLGVQLTVLLPHIYVTSEYDVDGRLLVVPLKGKGFFKGNLTNVRAELSGKGKLKTVKGVEVVEIQTINAKLEVGEYNVHFDNTDTSTAAIAETAANFINQNKKDVFDVVRPVAEETLAEVALQIGNSIFSHLPFAEILPD